MESIKAYLEEAIASFRDAPPETDYDKGYLSALIELIQTEGLDIDTNELEKTL